MHSSVLERTEYDLSKINWFCGVILLNPIVFVSWGSDTIQARSNSDFDVKSATIQVYGNNYNFQSDYWIELKFYVESSDMLSYLGLKF